MSVEPTESNVAPPPAPSPAASLKSGRSPLSQKTKLIVGVAVVVFLIFAAVIGLSIFGTLVSGIFGGTVESQVSSRGSYVEQKFLKGIDDLKVTKGRDSLRLRFRLSAVDGQVCGPCKFTVVMADSDGQTIHFFTTQPVFQLWDDWREIEQRKVDLTYRINPGIAKRTKYVEVGVTYN
jgi:hypothetical protein